MLTEAAVDASATAAPRPPACVPSSLRAPPGLPAQHRWLFHADIICEAPAVASPVGQKGARALPWSHSSAEHRAGIPGAAQTFLGRRAAPRCSPQRCSAGRLAWPSKLLVTPTARRCRCSCMSTSVSPLQSISAGGPSQILSDAMDAAADDGGASFCHCSSGSERRRHPCSGCDPPASP